jgi:hypothetical protein
VSIGSFEAAARSRPGASVLLAEPGGVDVSASTITASRLNGEQASEKIQKNRRFATPECRRRHDPAIAA